MPRCSDCSGDRCSCVIVAGENVTVDGAGTYNDPYVVTASGAGGGAGGWSPGDIKTTAVAVAPTGWLVANGQAVSRASYAALYSAIGTTYGPGDGSTTFNLPDLAGRFPLGADGTHARGAVGGSEASTLSVANLPGHTHTISHTHSIAHSHAVATSGGQSQNHQHSGTTAPAGNHSHLEIANSANFAAVMQEGTGPIRSYMIGATAQSTGVDGNHNHNFATSIENQDHTHSVTVPAFSGSSGAPSVADSGSTGSAAAFSNMPPWVGVTFLIKT